MFICGEILAQSLDLQLLWEMEILISNATKKKCTSDVFIGRWKALSIFFLDDSESNKGMSKHKDEYLTTKTKHI